MAIRSVRILSRKYDILIKKRLENAGECDYTAAKLSVAAGMDAHETKDALLHEVFHAILYQQGREYGGDVEETYVRALATGLVAVLKDNPKFAAYLSS